MNKKIIVCLISATILIVGGKLLYGKKDICKSNSISTKQVVVEDKYEETKKDSKKVNIEKKLEDDKLRQAAKESNTIKKPDINNVRKSSKKCIKQSEGSFQDNEAIEIVKSLFKKDDEKSKQSGGHIGYEVVEKNKTDNGMYFKIRRYEIRDDRIVTLGWYSIVENNKRVMDEIIGDYLN